MIMTTPTIADYLKYANLQMAAEAFLYDESAKTTKTHTRSQPPIVRRTAA